MVNPAWLRYAETAMPSTRTGFQPGAEGESQASAISGPGAAPGGQTIFGRDIHLPREALDQIARRSAPAVVPVETPGSGRATIGGAQAGPRVAPAPIAPPSALVSGAAPPTIQPAPSIPAAHPAAMAPVASAVLPPPELPSWVDELEPARASRTLRLPRHEGLRTVLIVALAMGASFSLVAGVMKMRTAFRGGGAALETARGAPPVAPPAGTTVVVPALPPPTPSARAAAPAAPPAAAEAGAREPARARPGRPRAARPRPSARPEPAPAAPARTRRHNNDDAIMVPKFVGS